VLQSQKGKMKKLWISAAAVLLGLGVASGVSAQSTFLSVGDGVAGESVAINFSGATTNEKISFLLERPDHTKIQISAQADEWGRARTEISALHVQQAGAYKLTATRQNFSSAIESFTIFPGAVSRYRSTVSTKNPAVAADGEAIAWIKISLRDAYGNPLSDRAVSVFSSRNSDRVLATKKTDDRGEISAKIFSAEPGVSVISAVVDGELLFEKPEIIFFLADDGLPKNVGSIGDFLKTQLFDDPEESSAVAYLSIEELASETTVGQDLTVRVVARDEVGNIVPNYLGTVRFSSTDSKAQLPNDYTFAPSDQGQHTFFLAVRFEIAGNQTLGVHDLSDFRISGEMSTNAILNSGPVLVVPDQPSLKITMPPDGSTFNTARVTITGESYECDTVKLLDGTYVLIESLEVDATKKYVYQTPTLADGMHQFQADCVNGPALISGGGTLPSLVSNKVTITIDRTPPQAMGIEQVPSGCLEPGRDFQLKVTASDELSSVRCVFNEFLTEFSPEDEKTFSANFVAPMAEGDFPVSCTLFDLLGNVLDEQNAGVVCVEEDFSATDSEIEDFEIDDFVLISDEIAPTAVSSLTAASGEIEKSTLFWSPATDNTGVKNYQINYNKCGEDLTKTNFTPDDRTQWYVEPLEPCEKYCFQVTAIDADGNNSSPSNVAEGTPFCPEPVHEAPPKTGANTPWWAILIATIVGAGAVFALHRRA